LWKTIVDQIKVIAQQKFLPKIKTLDQFLLRDVKGLKNETDNFLKEKTNKSNKNIQNVCSNINLDS
jgi:hypothetical protein